MENKNLLQSKGSLYVGAGFKKQINTAEGLLEIPKTTCLEPTVANTFLVAIPSTGELKYQKLTSDMLDSNATYNITCENATYTDYVTESTEAEYGYLAESFGTIEDRLTRAESGYYRRCNFSYPPSHSSQYKAGHVVQNLLHKQGARVTMKLSIYNCYLTSFGDRDSLYDYITVVLPSEFRPKYTKTIPVSLSTFFTFLDADGELQRTSRFMTTVYVSFDSRGSFNISYELIRNSLPGDCNYCTAIEISAGWEDFR